MRKFKVLILSLSILVLFAGMIAGWGMADGVRGAKAASAESVGGAELLLGSPNFALYDVVDKDGQAWLMLVVYGEDAKKLAEILKGSRFVDESRRLIIVFVIEKEI